MSPRASRVLVPASAETAARIAPLLRSSGFEPVLAPLIASAPVEFDAELGRRVKAAGNADWLVLTSKAAVSALTDRFPSGRRQVAAVGRRTAEALAATEVEPDLVGEGGATDLAEQLIARSARQVVLAGSAQSHQELDERLRAAEVEVERIDLYRTVPVAAPAAVLALAEAGEIAAALVTSGTVAEQLQAQFGAALERIVLVSFGAQTTADIQRLGLRVAAEARVPTLPALVGALAELAEDPTRFPPLRASRAR